MGDKAIIAGFASAEIAEQAKQELEELGIIDVKIDEIDFVPGVGDEEGIEHPITGDFPGLASSVYDARLERDESILLSASPDASGMVDNATDSIGTDITLTVVVEEDKLEAAAKILEEYGAYF